MDNKRIPWIAWQPDWRAALPLIFFVVGGSLVFALIRLGRLPETNVLLWVADSIFLLIAVYCVLCVSRQPLAAVGATERNWPQAMGIGAVLGILLGMAALVRDLLAGGTLAIPPLDVSMLAFVVPLLLVVAGEEVFFRGWFRASLEPAVGVLPTVLLASLAYALWPLAFTGGLPAAHPFAHTPIGQMTMLTRDLPLLFVVALFLNAIFRMTGSLWASGLASFLGRFTLAFVVRPTTVQLGSPLLLLAVALALWAVVLLYARRWRAGLAKAPAQEP